MPTIARSQENTTSIINWFLTLQDVKFDAYLVEYRILDITSGLPGTQIFPAVDGTWEDVTSSPGKFETGSYYAYDNTAGTGWTPSASANLGTHRIEWRWKDTITSSYQEGTEDFTITAGSIGSGQDLYITLDYMRSAGVPTSVTDDQINEAIILWQSMIERITGQWFLPREHEFLLDGTDSDALHLSVPIIEIEEVEINMGRDGVGTGTVLDAEDYRVYNRVSAVDDRMNPRIKLIDQLLAERNIYTSSSWNSRRKFLWGRQNQRIKGIFGYTDSTTGGCPPAIKRALFLILLEKLAVPPIGTNTLSPPIIHGVVTEEWTDGHKYSMQIPGGSVKDRVPGLSGLFNNPEIEQILRMYKAPLPIATVNSMSY